MSDYELPTFDWKYFSTEELRCSHTAHCKMNPRFMELLVRIREQYDRPMIISSGYRAPTHPIEARKDNKDGLNLGAHCQGRAVDVLCHGKDAFDLIHIAIHKGIKRIGVSQSGELSKRFIHIDNITHGKPCPWIWSY